MDKTSQYEDVLPSRVSRRLMSGKVTNLVYKPQRKLTPPFKKSEEMEIMPYGKGVFAITKDFNLVFCSYKNNLEPVGQKDPVVMRHLALYLLRYDFMYQYCAKKFGLPIISQAIKTTQEDLLRIQNNYRGCYLESLSISESFEYYQPRLCKSLIFQMEGFLKDPFMYRFVRHHLAKLEALKMHSITSKHKKNETFYGNLGRWLSAKQTKMRIERMRQSREK